MLILEEWDYVQGGGGGLLIAEAKTNDIHGAHGELTILADPAGRTIRAHNIGVDVVHRTKILRADYGGECRGERQKGGIHCVGEVCAGLPEKRKSNEVALNQCL